MKNKWTREELIVAFALYCITPLPKVSPRNELLIRASENMDHSVSSLVMCMRNFQHVDETTEKGLCHAGKNQKAIYDEFKNDWGSLGSEAERISGLILFDEAPEKGTRLISSRHDHYGVNKERLEFRKYVEASYNNKCCVTGLNFPDLMVASHIKPYRECRSKSERVDPRNGLLLNAFYDRAFENGYITLARDYTFKVAQEIKDLSGDPEIEKWFISLDGRPMIKPTGFMPSHEAIEYHNDVVFERKIG